ncbi:MAG: hypothetical protein EAZ30_02900 [Betaproteobacteria bacterium]|nr:MAG: hypothetical protein EAZ30_02900 [Betaproteobacteria bacterium]
MGLPALSERVTELEKQLKAAKLAQEGASGLPSGSPVPDLGQGIPLPGVPLVTTPGAGRSTLRSSDAPPTRINVSPPSNAGTGAVIPALEPADNRTDMKPSVAPRAATPSFEIRSTDERSDGSGKQSSQLDASDAVSVTPAVATNTESTSTTAQVANPSGGAAKQTSSRPTPIAAGDRRTDRVRTEDAEQILPSGSMVSGVMLTGLDAPTSNQGRRDPIPVLIRVKSEAILPNRFTLDLRECFLLASGYGDLSSERAYLRAERLSCVREDGKVIDTTLDATLQGRDGKAGLRGRVVHKNGQLIANSLMTGFLSGFAGALGSTRVPTLNVAPTGSATFESAGLGDIAKSGAASGVGNAVGKIADYYLEMGRSIFPVIEIDAGQEVDFIVTAAQKLKLGVSGGSTVARSGFSSTAALAASSPSSTRRINR